MRINNGRDHPAGTGILKIHVAGLAVPALQNLISVIEPDQNLNRQYEVTQPLDAYPRDKQCVALAISAGVGHRIALHNARITPYPVVRDSRNPVVTYPFPVKHLVKEPVHVFPEPVAMFVRHYIVHH